MMLGKRVMEHMKLTAKIEDVKLVVGLLGSSKGYLERGVELLEGQFGAVDFASEIIPFDYTTYYNREMGDSIVRQFLSFEKLVYPGRLAEIKVDTNQMEQIEAVDRCRRINIDPGYLTLASVVLATTKDASFRVYLGKGIFAQTTLCYRDNTFQPYEWTYKDYRDERHIAFFNRVRDKYRQQMQAVRAKKND